MNRSWWRAVGLCVSGSFALAWGLNWFTQQLAAERMPGELAYRPVEDMPPRVDLVSVQRDWPDSLDRPGDRSRLTAYLRDIEGSAPPPAAGPQAGASPAAPVDLGALLAGADARSGADKARVCATCHDFTPGGPNRMGPNLWGVVGRDIASHPGFAYSPAMTAQPGVWSYDQLYAYLGSPVRAVPGTKMSFAGLRRPEDRAAVIRYLATLGSTAPPLPVPGGSAAGSTQAAR